MSREPRRPGEKWFEWCQRTTHPDAWMHVLSGGAECCRRNNAGDRRFYRAHDIPDFDGKEQP